MTKSYKEKLKQSLLLLQNEVLKKNLKVAIAFSHQNEDVVNIALSKEVLIMCLKFQKRSFMLEIG